jgi:Pyruvate/2-oxoacid:ferredoxin oxidoreductase gamma subunit
LAALSGVVSLDAVVGAIRERFNGPLADGNAAAAAAAYRIVAEQQEEVANNVAPA